MTLAALGKVDPGSRRAIGGVDFRNRLPDRGQMPGISGRVSLW